MSKKAVAEDDLQFDNPGNDAKLLKKGDSKPDAQTEKAQ